MSFFYLKMLAILLTRQVNHLNFRLSFHSPNTHLSYFEFFSQNFLHWLQVESIVEYSLLKEKNIEGYLSKELLEASFLCFRFHRYNLIPSISYVIFKLIIFIQKYLLIHFSMMLFFIILQVCLNLQLVYLIIFIPFIIQFNHLHFLILTFSLPHQLKFYLTLDFYLQHSLSLPFNFMIIPIQSMFLNLLQNQFQYSLHQV